MEFLWRIFAHESFSRQYYLSVSRYGLQPLETHGMQRLFKFNDGSPYALLRALLLRPLSGQLVGPKRKYEKIHATFMGKKWFRANEPPDWTESGQLPGVQISDVLCGSLAAKFWTQRSYFGLKYAFFLNFLGLREMFEGKEWFKCDCGLYMAKSSLFTCEECKVKIFHRLFNRKMDL